MYLEYQQVLGYVCRIILKNSTFFLIFFSKISVTQAITKKKTARRRTYRDCLGNHQFFIFQPITLSDGQCLCNLPLLQVSSCFFHGIIIFGGPQKVRSFCLYLLIVLRSTLCSHLSNLLLLSFVECNLISQALFRKRGGLIAA